jgi:FdhD protein
LEQDWPGYVEMDIRKIGGEAGETADAVAVEHYLTVELGGRGVATLACTPSDLEELAAGFLVGQGLVPVGATPEAVGYSCRLSPDRRVAGVTTGASGAPPGEPGPADGCWDKFIGSGCGAGLVHDQDRLLLEIPPVTWEGALPAGRLTGLAAALQTSPLFRLTGGTHSALAATVAPGGGSPAGPPAGLIVHREDIGRHNAVDKVVGHLWLTGRLGGGSGPFILVTSGRLSSDIVLKAARAGFPVAVSHGAPTVMAVEMARRLGLTLVGFARGWRMNVYTGGERVPE